MRSIAVAMHKEGVGKTSVAVNLAAALATHVRPVLLLDLDPQCNASDWLKVSDADHGLYEALHSNGPLEALVQPTAFRWVDCISASPRLARIPADLADRPEAYTFLGDLLGTLPLDRWSYLIIDCPPSLGPLCLGAVTAVDEVLMPVLLTQEHLEGLDQFIDTLDALTTQLDIDLVARAVLNRFIPGHPKMIQLERALRRKYPELVCHTTLRESKRMLEASRNKAPVRGAIVEEFRVLAKELRRATLGLTR